jgi:WD40 repeat protein
MALLAKEPADRPTADQALALMSGSAQTARPSVFAAPTVLAAESKGPAAVPTTTKTDPDPEPGSRAPVPRRRLRTLKVPGAAALAVAFSPDAAVLAAGCADGTIKLWDPASGALLRNLTGHREAVRCVAFNEDGGWIASGSEDAQVRLWNLRTRQHISLSSHTRSVTMLALSPDGRRLVTAGPGSSTACLWNARTGARLHILSGHTAEICAVAFSPNGAELATADHDSRLIIRDPNTGGERKRIRLANADLSCLAYSPDGRLVVASLGSGAHSLLSTRSERPPQAITGPMRYTSCAKLSPDAGYFATSTTTGFIHLWDPRTKSLIVTLTTRQHKLQYRAVTDIAIGPEGAALAVAMLNQTICIYA